MVSKERLVEAIELEPVCNPARDCRLACVFMEVELIARGPAG